jgi:hypothetical protein
MNKRAYILGYMQKNAEDNQSMSKFLKRIPSEQKQNIIGVLDDWYKSGYGYKSSFNPHRVWKSDFANLTPDEMNIAQKVYNIRDMNKNKLVNGLMSNRASAYYNPITNNIVMGGDKGYVTLAHEAAHQADRKNVLNYVLKYVFNTLNPINMINKQKKDNNNNKLQNKLQYLEAEVPAMTADQSVSIYRPVTWQEQYMRAPSKGGYGPELGYSPRLQRTYFGHEIKKWPQVLKKYNKDLRDPKTKLGAKYKQWLMHLNADSERKLQNKEFNTQQNPRLDSGQVSQLEELFNTQLPKDFRSYLTNTER